MTIDSTFSTSIPVVAGVPVGTSVGSSGAGGGTASAFVPALSPGVVGHGLDESTWTRSVILSVMTTAILVWLATVYNCCGAADRDTSCGRVSLTGVGVAGGAVVAV